MSNIHGCRILFLSDTDQIGKSGVGDYTIGLCEELNALGCITRIFPVHNFRSQHVQLKQLIKHFNPDWISIQYVPFTFALKGLVTPIDFPGYFYKRRFSLHFLFHETWIGAHNTASFKQKIVGLFQKTGISITLRLLNPRVIHTTNSLYSGLISSAGFPNKVLPLFGAIPFNPNPRDPYVEELQKISKSAYRQYWTIAVFFGTIHACPSLLAAIKRVHHLSVSAGKSLLIVSLGFAKEAPRSFNHIKEAMGDPPSLHFLIKGFLPSMKISNWLKFADCGVSTTPMNIINKSSSAVAFAEHGTPVIVTSMGDRVGKNTHIVDNGSNHFIHYLELPETRSFLPAKFEQQSFRSRVAHQFLSDLTHH